MTNPTIMLHPDSIDHIEVENNRNNMVFELDFE
jgi:hypothetical protein